VNKDTGEIIQSFAIITTVANELMQKLGHHRSPVIVPQAREQEWISNDLSLEEVTSFLEPYPAESMNAYPISPAIKSIKENGIHLLKPTGERVFPEFEYELYEEIKLFGMGESPARNRKKEES
jgi:putative SOS response-associated peptidase YedK